MIISDFSQTLRSIVLVESECKECAKHPSEQNKKLIKHFIINSMRFQYKQHKGTYGNMILACDSNSWRKDIFPQYKWKRGQDKAKDDSGIRWDFVFETFDEVIHDLDKHFPFIVLRYPKAEGDDIIGTMIPYLQSVNLVEDVFGNTDPEPMLIISSDRDHVQLHSKTVKQYSAIEKKMIKSDIPVRNALITKIVKGDSGDGVPSIKSHDNIFVEGTRQKPISEKYLQSFFDAKNPIDACLTEEERVNFLRNEKLVSYAKIPEDIKTGIIALYNEKKECKHSKMELMNYMTENRMTNLLSQIYDFY